VKNFMTGLLLGWLATYWYFTQGAFVRGMVDDFWARASAPPPLARQAK